MGYLEDIRIAALSCDKLFPVLAGCNVLVTGSTGLIGAALVKMLLSIPNIDFNVYAMGRNAERAQELYKEYIGDKHFHFVCQDILRPFKVGIDFDYIIHAASFASPADFVSRPVEIAKSNIIGLCNLLDYGKAHNLKRLLYISSGEVYGEGDGREFRENYSGYINCLSARSCYPTSKRAAESICVSYYQEYGIESVIARLSHVYGPEFSSNDNRVYAQFFRNALAKEDIVLKSKGDQLRSWCYVVDCASALLTVMLKGNAAEAYNVTNDESNVSIRQLAEIIASIAGTKVVFQLPETKESKGYNPVSKSVFDITKLKSLGWAQLFSLETGLRHSIEYLKHQ